MANLTALKSLFREGICAVFAAFFYRHCNEIYHRLLKKTMFCEWKVENRAGL
jgi:hypothetical protein